MCSATADCQTPIHNYDFNYIAKQGVKVEKMGNDALHKIEKYIALNYANPKVEFSLYNEEETEPKEILEDYLGKCSLALKDCLDFVMDGKNKFNKNNSARIVNMLNHYMDFMKKPEAKAWLYFQPFSYTGNSSIGIKKVLNILQQARVTKRGEVYEVSVMDPYVIDDGTTSRRADIYPKLNVCFLSGEYFKDDLEAVEKLLAEQPELKMFCFVCYQSGAVGVNYLFDTDAKYRKKCCLEAPNTKDRKDTRCNFDGIIMDKPTNFIPLLDVNDYLKACISLSILGTDNQLTLKEKSDFQRDLLRRRHHCITDDLNELKNREIQIKQKRPMKRIMDPLSQMGADITSVNGNGCAPLAINGRTLHGIHYQSPVASAQVKSAILLAGLYAEGETKVTEPSLSRNHTELMLKEFGADVRTEKTTAIL